MNSSTNATTPPPLLYKFLSLADGQSPSWQERLTQLLDGRCFHPGAAAFNDPFDCWPYAEIPGSKAQFEEEQAPFVAALTEAIRRDLPADFIQGRIREKLAAEPIAEINDNIQQGLRLNADATGVFCLAACIESTLMWSHYASNHSGIALRFDFRRQPYGGLNPLWKVEYQDDRPVLAELLSVNTGTALPRALATKSTVWAYEQEWRSMKADGAGTVVRFNPEVLTGVVFGAGCRPDDEAWIRDVVRGRGFDLERMRPNRRTFDLDRILATAGD